MPHRATLQSLVRTLAAAVPGEGRLEVKLALAAHLHDDARALEQLGGAPASDAELLSLQAAYGSVKPTLAAALRGDALDGPEAFLTIAHQQERHVAELPAHLLSGDPPDPDADAARDPFVVDEPTGPQRLLHETLTALERAVREGDYEAAARAAERAGQIDAQLTADGTPWGA